MVIRRSKELRDEAEGLRERIKHLNDMVFCQQKKIKSLIEEVRSSERRNQEHVC